jgi:hypothetical protein
MSLLPSRKARWVLVLFGALFVAQGLGKALDPTGYMAVLAQLHARPALLAPVSLGALALCWTVLEILAGVAIMYGGLSRTPAKQLALAGMMLALGLSCAYLSLTLGAYARQVPIESCTFFGRYLPQRLSWFVLLQETYVVAMLAWLFSIVLRWPSLDHVDAPLRPRSLSAA